MGCSPELLLINRECNKSEFRTDNYRWCRASGILSIKNSSDHKVRTTNLLDKTQVHNPLNHIYTL